MNIFGCAIKARGMTKVVRRSALPSPVREGLPYPVSFFVIARLGLAQVKIDTCREGKLTGREAASRGWHSRFRQAEPVNT